MPERDLAGVAGKEHQRSGPYGGEQHLVGEVERESPGDEWQTEHPDREDDEAGALHARIEQSHVLRVRSTKVAARARDAHTRSSSSRVPNNPHGRNTSMARSTTNGATSETSGSTQWISSTSAAAPISEPASAPSRLSSPPTSAAGKALSPITTIVCSSAASVAISMPARPPVNVASAQARA